MNYSLSVNEILDLPIFKCKHCAKRCQYPVMVADKSGNYCFSCLSQIQYNVAETNLEINEILEKLIVPCRFNSNGCDLAEKIADITKHEKLCEFRDRVCPFYYLSKCKSCTLSDIPDHFDIQHASCVIKSENDVIKIYCNANNTSDMDIIQLLRIYNENFILHIKFDIDNKVLLYALYLCGDPEFIKSYDCSIQQQNNDIHTNSKAIFLLHESDFIIPVDRTKAVCYDLPTLQRCFDEIETVIKISSKNISAGIKNNELLNNLKCPTCKVYMRDEIHQCTSGHSVCKDCIIEFQKCSICNAPFSGTRNYTLESLTTLLKYPCSHRNCHKYFSTKNITLHEWACPFKEYECPFRETLHCRWNGIHKNINQHLKDKHHDTSLKNNYCERKIPLNNINNEVYALMAFNNIFRFHLEKETNTYSFSCKYIGPKIQAKRFMFEIGLINQEKNDNKLIIKNCWNKLSEDEVWVEIHHHDVLQYATNQNDILVYYKVLKYLP